MSLGCKKSQRGLVINHVGYCVLSWLESSWVEPRVGCFLLEHSCLFRDTVTTPEGSSNQWPRKTPVHRMTADPHSLTRHQSPQQKAERSFDLLSLFSCRWVLLLSSSLTSHSRSLDVWGANDTKKVKQYKQWVIWRYLLGSVVTS